MNILLSSRLSEELRKGESASIIELIDALLEHAFDLRASDIHIDPNELGMAIRMRVDGLLYHVADVSKIIRWEIVSRIKIMAALRTDEHQCAQDGRFRIVIGGCAIDVRISIMPTYHGENIVLRLLIDRMKEMTLDLLGLDGENKQKISAVLTRPGGMILATGPTGSGKTTTLYAMLKVLAKSTVSVVTIEDPIEYAIEGIRQIQVNQKTGLSFSNGLRAIVRQDPDIIMVGEIRDQETADLAINSSLTGHLVLSTLHTNDAITTIIRLLDMNIEPYLVASTVTIAVAQRLVRRICRQCVFSYAPLPEERAICDEFNERPTDTPYFFRGKGCEKCNTTGYDGRVGLYEVLMITDDLREIIAHRPTIGELRSFAKAHGVQSLHVDGVQKVIAGITTLDELLRVRYE